MTPLMTNNRDQLWNRSDKYGRTLMNSLLVHQRNTYIVDIKAVIRTKIDSIMSMTQIETSRKIDFISTNSSLVVICIDNSKIADHKQS